MKTKIKVIIIIVLAIILGVMIYFYASNGNSSGSEFDTTMSGKSSNFDTNSISTEDLEKIASGATSSGTTISTSTQVSSALTEKLELHATYYLESVLAEENTEIQSGDNIIEYTNGTYLTAPYDCVITSINVPEEGEQCTSSHYIEIESTNRLSVSMSIDEAYIDSVSVGDEATITISALDDVSITGYVTNISSVGSRGSFTITIEFDNSYDIKIGMSATVSLVVGQ